MHRLRTTFGLARTSWSVLRRDRELLWLPVLSFLTSVAVLVAFAVPILAVVSVSGGSDDGGVGTTVYLLVLLASLSLGIVAVFFNGALVAGAHERLSGGDPTVRSSLSRAWARLPGLVPWALITTTVGMVLRALRDRAGGIGRFVVSLVGAAWEVVTFLVVPAVVIDELGPIEGLKRSGELFRRTWGENVAARVGFGLLAFLALVPGILVIVLGAATGLAVVTVAAIVAGGVWIALVGVVMSALTAVFQTALYHYATTGRVPDGFEAAHLPEAFGHR